MWLKFTVAVWLGELFIDEVVVDVNMRLEVTVVEDERDSGEEAVLDRSTVCVGERLGCCTRRGARSGARGGVSPGVDVAQHDTLAQRE